MSSDLHLDLNPDSPGGLRGRIEEALREAILSGRLRRGARLPATRTLADDLGVSRGTVFDVYAQLTAEGWLWSQQGSGTFVAVDQAAPAESATAVVQTDLSWSRMTTAVYDMSDATIPDLSSFPRGEWVRAFRRALESAPHRDLGYTDPRGIESVRAEIARYLARSRGLQVTAANIVVTTGYTQSLNLLLRTTPLGRVAIEDPASEPHRTIVSAAGHTIAPLPVDDDGARIEELEDDIRVVVLTPNRQFPLGMPLSPPRRAALLDWARQREAIVIENDYDGEFRYDGRPLTALQSLAPSHVVYAGTASKTLAPGLRIGWLAVPAQLTEQLGRIRRYEDVQNSALEQLAFAEFLRSGAYDRHVRRQRIRYRRRRDKLIAALAPRYTVSGRSAGLTLIVDLDSEEEEQRLIAIAAERGVAVVGLHQEGFYLDPAGTSRRSGLLVGFASQPERLFDIAVETLAGALNHGS